MPNFSSKRAQILQQMGQISAMEYGSLKAEVRTAKDGSTSGPYYQHQVWDSGKNISQRIPADQAPALQGAIDGRQQFEQLAEEYVDTTVQMTRAHQGLSTESKKNSRRSNRKSLPKRPNS
jgi:hypothetical protein